MLTVAGVAAAGLIAYAVYFDYRRRNDGDFRKKLRMYPTVRHYRPFN